MVGLVKKKDNYMGNKKKKITMQVTKQDINFNRFDLIFRGIQMAAGELNIKLPINFLMKNGSFMYEKDNSYAFDVETCPTYRIDMLSEMKELIRNPEKANIFLVTSEYLEVVEIAKFIIGEK